MRWDDISTAISYCVNEQNLPKNFTETCRDFYFPLAQYLVAQTAFTNRPLIVGINGAQGTGKSTLAALMQGMLKTGAGLQCAILSIDDLYLTRTERAQLAQKIHPLLKTRGAPGTHDIDMGLKVIDALRSNTSTLISLPRFDKAQDERKPQAEWPQQTTPVDVIILEGWCVGALPQQRDALEKPINQLESDEDPQGHWRQYVNQQLAGRYQRLFSTLDFLIMLKAPSMEAIEEWRWLQEEKLIMATGGTGEGLMNHTQVKRFIQHYERLTRHILDEMPPRANLVFHLNPNHQIDKMTGPLAAGLIS